MTDIELLKKHIKYSKLYLEKMPYDELVDDTGNLCRSYLKALDAGELLNRFNIHHKYGLLVGLTINENVLALLFENDIMIANVVHEPVNALALLYLNHTIVQMNNTLKHRRFTNDIYGKWHKSHTELTIWQCNQSINFIHRVFLSQ